MKHSKEWLAELDKVCPTYTMSGTGWGYRFKGEACDRSACTHKTERGAKFARAKDPRVLSFFKCAD